MNGGKRILLTGASAGIGLYTSHRLCAAGHEVWGTSRSLDNLPKLRGFRPIVMDFADPASIKSGFGSALREAKHFDVLINNAGAGAFGPLEGFSDEDLRTQIDSLLLAPLRLIRLALPQMRARRAGLIINMTSLASELPLPFMAPYTMAKAALSAASESLSLEVRPAGIRVVDVRPGDFSTRFHQSTRQVGEHLASAYSPALEQAWAAIDRHMKAAPGPEQVADELFRLVGAERHRPSVAVGDFFQARLARFFGQHMPRAWVLWGIRRYYGMGAS